MSGMCHSPSVEPKPGDVHLREFLFSDPASPPACSYPRGMSTETQGGKFKDVHCTVAYSGKGLKVAQASITGGWK